MNVKYILITVLLVGCGSVPVKRTFPEVPERLLVTCPQLEKLGDEVKLSDVAKTVTVNYSTYYDCAVRHDGLVEWYKIQKHIFESVK
jgi:hypothetical protein